METTYLRFVTDTIDPECGTRAGVFQASFDLVDGNVLADYELAELEALQKWFAAELKAPARLSRRDKSRAARRGICWFKSSAVEHVSRMYQICRILQDHGIRCDVIRTTRPGYIVFEDDFQIVAEPYSDTVT